MTFRDDMIACADELRNDIADVEFQTRLHTVKTRRRSWSDGRVGKGTATDTDVTITPKPKVGPVDTRLRMAEPGKYQDGDRLVRKVSATYTEEQLTGETVAANEEFYWLVDDEEHRVIEVTERYIGWRVVLRRMQKRPS